MEKHSKLGNFIKALIIIVIAVLTVIVLSNVLVLKSEDGINQMQALYKQPEDSIDVIFTGSSLVYCNICPGVLWDNYGIASFDLGGAEAPAWVTYYMLKEALKTQHPKVIFYEVSIAALYPEPYQVEEWASDNNYGMKWNSNRLEQLRLNSGEDDYRFRLNPFNIMHGRYRDLDENDFRNVRDSADYKGFDPREAVVETDTPDVSGVTDAIPCTEKAEEYTRKIIELGKSEGIEVVLFVAPRDIEEEDMKICNYMGKIAESEGVEFINFNLKYDEIGLDFSKDMSTGSHLGYSGNYKFSDYLGKIIKEKYDIPDNRGNSKYDSWERDAEYSRYERNDLKIQMCDNATDVLSLTEKGYILFAVDNGNVSVFVDNEAVAGQVTDGSFDMPIRLPFSYGGDTFLIKSYVDDGNPMISLFVNDSENMEYYGNIIFVYDAVRHEYIRSVYF